MTKESIQQNKSKKIVEGRGAPTKSQHQVLSFVAEFINQHGYGPSYREIMRGCGYSTLSSVSMHVDALIMLGLLSKKDRGARSLQVLDAAQADSPSQPAQGLKSAAPKTYEKWLSEQITLKFNEAEESLDESSIDNLYILVGALKILGFDAAAIAFKTRLAEILDQIKKM